MFLAKSIATRTGYDEVLHVLKVIAAFKRPIQIHGTNPWTLQPGSTVLIKPSRPLQFPSIAAPCGHPASSISLNPFHSALSLSSSSSSSGVDRDFFAEAASSSSCFLSASSLCCCSARSCKGNGPTVKRAPSAFLAHLIPQKPTLQSP